MWIKQLPIASKALWRDANYKHVVFALAVSVLLHVIVLGQLYFHLPNVKYAPHIIKLRLAPHQTALIENHATLTSNRPPKFVPQAPRQLAKKTPVNIRPKFDATSEVLEANPQTVMPEEAAAIVLAESNVALPVESTNTEEIAQSPVEPTPPTNERLGVALNRNAYKYVETDFDAYTQSNANVAGAPVGTAKIIYQLRSDEEQYQITSTLNLQGLAAIFVPDFLQTSEGYLTKTGLQPTHYMSQASNTASKTYRADFDWRNKLITLSGEGNNGLTLALTKTTHTDATQDLLSVMYQFMLISPLPNMQVSIANGKTLDLYNYRVEGEENIETNMGNLKTVHLMAQSENREEKTELWLAVDYQRVPVKIRKTAIDGKVVELLATSINTEQSANLQ